MGFFSLVAFSAAGFWSARAISRLNAKVPRIRVPISSPLARLAQIRGDVYADTFVIELPQKVAFSRLPVEVEQFARAFYSSKVFASLEKPLLKLIFGLKEPQLRHCEFSHGEKILLWTVANRLQGDILLEWESRGFSGLTWFHVSVDQRYLMFGSSIGYDHAYKYHTRLHSDVSPSWLLMKTLNDLKNNPQELSIIDRLSLAIYNSVTFGVISVHQWYSRLLLVSALKTLVLEES